MRLYTCSSCGKPITSSHGVIQREKITVDDEGKEDKVMITGEGLGTWRCTCGADVRYVTVTRDLSGGKEAAKGERAVPVSVKRHVAVKRVP